MDEKKEPKALSDKQIQNALDKAFKQANFDDRTGRFRDPASGRLVSTKPKVKGRKRLSPQEQARRTAQIEANRLVNVNLTMQHIRNGVVYGPGTVRVSNNLAQDMLHTEQNFRKQEEIFYGSRAAIIGPRVGGGHIVKPVPYETFDHENANIGPDMFADHVKGTAHGSDTGTGNKF